MLLFCTSEAPMKYSAFFKIMIVGLLVSGIFHPVVCAQDKKGSPEIKKASRKVKSSLEKDDPYLQAKAYFDLGESYYKKGELQKSEDYYKRSKEQYEKIGNSEGIAQASRALAKVQEELNKDKEAIGNYSTALENNIKTGDTRSNTLNDNDINRLKKPSSLDVQQRLIKSNINLGLLNKDTGEIISGYLKMGDLNLQHNRPVGALDAYNNAYNFSRNIPEQAQRFNQRITDVYLGEKNFVKAIETKKEILNESFTLNSTKIQAEEIQSLADIYLLKKEDSTAVRLFRESYLLSVQNGHTLEARSSIQKLDSIFQANGRKDLSLHLYKEFLIGLPDIIAKDSSIADNKIIAETEARIKELETEKAYKDELIRRKNVFNYWLLGSMIVLVLFIGIILYLHKRLRTNSKKIALQSLRREMNPHFIFNSLNSINQFIANNNELEANRYLTKFSTLMRRVMENSKEDFVLFSKEIELLQNYLELEKSRFPDKFDFNISIDDSLLADEHLYIPGMLVQPHLENAVWHGLRYIDEKGFLQLSFSKTGNEIEIIIEDNGIGIAGSKKSKTSNQKKHSGRGITNTLERIKILNQLYNHHITCYVEDKQDPGRGVKVKITVPYLKQLA